MQLLKRGAFDLETSVPVKHAVESEQRIDDFLSAESVSPIRLADYLKALGRFTEFHKHQQLISESAGSDAARNKSSTAVNSDSVAIVEPPTKRKSGDTTTFIKLRRAPKAKYLSLIHI